MDLGLKGKRAIVLGGSRGIGYAIAEALLEEGAIVAVGSRDVDNIHDATERLKKSGDVVGFVTDVSRAYTEDLQWACDHLKGLDIFVVNSGGPQKGGFESLRDKAWKDGWNDTLMPAVRGVRWASERMIKRGKGGRILIVSSLSARQPIPDLMLSNVYRAGLTAFTKTMAGELGPHGICINNILPGYVLTDRLKSLLEDGGDKDAALERIAGNTALKRVASPRELGRVAAFLCSDAASYITGTDILVDGGAVRGI